MHRHITLALEEFTRHARELGYRDMAPDQAITTFAAVLVSAPDALRTRACEWLYSYTAVAEDSRVLAPVTPDFLKAGQLANAEAVRSWKLFVHALNTYDRQNRPGLIHSVLNAVEELQEASGSL